MDSAVAYNNGPSEFYFFLFYFIMQTFSVITGEMINRECLCNQNLLGMDLGREWSKVSLGCMRLSP